MVLCLLEPLSTFLLTFSLFTALPHSPPPSSSRGNSFPVTIVSLLCRAGDLACCAFYPSPPASHLSPIQVFLCHLCTYSSHTHGAATRPLHLAFASASKSHSRCLLCQHRGRRVLSLSHTTSFHCDVLLVSSSSGDMTAPLSSLISTVSASFLSSLFFIPSSVWIELFDVKIAVNLFDDSLLALIC
ncbi:hypothetical protein PIB30_049179 [Stylosanthes scabra]|uniref:Secreted protein n=1 Tax=Stylosanthes scabra TaxID=79078 RepID=A0ABU6TI29_9FABA|nr:hypothetical protein [Stylosanthes scabra]